MDKEGESESQTKSQAGDPWSTGGDPWSSAKTDENKTHADVTVPESPMSRSFHAPKEKEEGVKTEEEDAKTDKKGQTVNEDTGARSSQDGSAKDRPRRQERCQRRDRGHREEYLHARQEDESMARAMARHLVVVTFARLV